MKDFFIFKYLDKLHFNSEKTVTVIFLHQKSYERQKNLIDELEEFHTQNILSDKFIVLIPTYADDGLRSWFFDDKEETFRRVPNMNSSYFDENYHVYDYNHKLDLVANNQICEDQDGFFKNLFRHGAVKIFKERGGLVESSSDHHFVFPSGKHCSKFIRTGNVLVNGSEVFFLAMQLLKFFIGIKRVYCDTSSINVVPFAVMELRRRFNAKIIFPVVNSFESYTLFENITESFSKDSLVLISSSTSGNIIDRILELGIAKREQLKVLYYLGSEENYRKHESSILCDLTYSESFTYGLPIFETFSKRNGAKCKLCEDHSRPLKITGDVFLTVQPKIKEITLKISDSPKFLNSFVRNFRGRKEDEILLKNYYRQDSDTSDEYEIFVDTVKLFEKPNTSFKEKLDNKINTHIPANVQYLLYLPDDGSKALANYIKQNVHCANSPELVHIDDVENIQNKAGSVVIVASSIVTGRHLLHVSRVLRQYKLLSLVYFIGIFRTSDEKYSEQLKKNLGLGRDGTYLYPVLAVQEIFCSNLKRGTSWEKEKQLWEKVLSDIDEDEKKDLFDYAKLRRQVLLENKQSIGLGNNVFLLKHNHESLELRKGFAFWHFDYQESEVFQSEVYFTISSILNHLKNKDINDPRSLSQTNYVRSILSPDNFHRFNDGIIQAALLRASEPEFLAYNLDSSSSLKIKTLIQSMCDEFNTSHGEGLMEFLLALALRKLRMLDEDTEQVLNTAKNVNNPIINGFSGYLIEFGGLME